MATTSTPYKPPTTKSSNLTKILGLTILLVITLVLYYQIFLILKSPNLNSWVMFFLSLAWGIGGVWLLFWLSSSIVELLPRRVGQRIMPWVFVAPTLFLVTYFLLLPTFRTFILSLQSSDSKKFVGLENYVYAFTSLQMLQSFKNNLTWLIFGGGLSIVLGLLIAALADRTKPMFETAIKSLIFLPMAISMVGAAVIWKLVYAYQPGPQQYGLWNAIRVALGQQSIPLLNINTPPINIPFLTPLMSGLNTYLLIVLLIWTQVGFAMVVFSAAIKGIPAELNEAARIDGANEVQSFFRITIPYIRATIISVSTTILIGTLKVFDIVQALTGGNFGTQIIANEQYTQSFRSLDYGRGAAVAMVLLLAVLPVVYYNVRDFSKEAKF